MNLVNRYDLFQLFMHTRIFQSTETKLYSIFGCLKFPNLLRVYSINQSVNSEIQNESNFLSGMSHPVKMVSWWDNWRYVCTLLTQKILSHTGWSEFILLVSNQQYTCVYDVIQVLLKSESIVNTVSSYLSQTKYCD